MKKNQNGVLHTKDGVMEYWSDGVLELLRTGLLTTPLLHHSITPFLLP